MALQIHLAKHYAFILDKFVMQIFQKYSLDLQFK